MGQIFNQFCEHIIWTNYGGPMVTILGRDIVVLITGYLLRMVVEALIFLFQEKRKNNGNKKN